ncbi:unnamed protein product [Lathyrus sativus]|nr:unnamed protein product [Lathyrus sativus]
MSQTFDDEPTQNNEPLIPNEEVGEATEDDLEEVRMQDLFGNNDDDVSEDMFDASTQTISVEPINLYNPPLHMQNICLENDEPIYVFGCVIPNHIEDEIDIGMEFENKEACILALQHWHITHSVDYWMRKSDNAQYVIKCKKTYCNFKCRASLRKKNSKWNIGKLFGPHTCTTTSMAHDHRKLDSEMISHNIKELVNRNTLLKVKETSYSDLPLWILVMKTYRPGSIIVLQTLPAISNDGSQIADKRIFHRLFWEF